MCASAVLVLTGLAFGSGNKAGEIGSIDPGKKEILINVKSGTNLKMGDLLEIETESGQIILEVIFPMMTSSKCKIRGNGKLSELSKGLAVYWYNAAKTVDVKNFGNIKMVSLEGGTFMMGSTGSEKERLAEETLHKVKLLPFYIGMYEVTQKDYEEVMGTNPGSFKGESLPVENVRWYDAIEYCNKLSENNNLKPYYKINKNAKDPGNTNDKDDLKYTVTILGGTGFRLPTEAEWEYACRGGSGAAFSYGSSLDSSLANFNGGNPYKAAKGLFRRKTTAVGSFKANPYGLYDMHGNVLEWCWDWYGTYGNTVNDPKGADSGEFRVQRGGCWLFSGGSLRSAVRIGSNPNYRNYSIGFRIVKNP